LFRWSIHRPVSALSFNVSSIEKIPSPAPRRKPVNYPQPSSQTLPARSRVSIVAAGFANLLRRAIGKKPPTFTYEPPSPTIDTPKRGPIPRILSRKDSPVRTDRPIRIVTNSLVSSPKTSRTSSTYSRSPPQTPTRAARPSINSIASSVNDIVDVENLHTTKEINAAILATQVEATRLLDAFKQLESTTVHRVHLQTARRLPSATSPLSTSSPLSASSPLSSTSPLSAASSLSTNRKPHRRIPPPLDLSDKASVDSRSSARTSLSRSKSVSSLRSRLYPPSPLSPRFFPTVHPTHSVSSIVSQIPSQRRTGTSNSVTASTSRSMLVDSEEVQPVVHGTEEGVASNAEVIEVQQKRNEVMARYEARLEYLRARLKGAELHEKLLRK
jgi:hypothetical protein